MTNRMRRFAALAAALAAAAAVWAQGLVVCPSCGREGKAEQTACAHCGKALPKPRVEAAPAAPAAPQVDNDAEVGRAAHEAAAASLRLARELEARQPEVALSYYQNALAVSRLVPPERMPAGAGEAILKGVDATMQALLRGQIPCRTCGGTGKYQMDLGKVDARYGVKAVDGVACPSCKGAGQLAGFRNNAKVKMAILQGRQEFERRQMVGGDVRVGRALVPAALAARLSRRQQALLMTGMPVPCSACQLTGRQACTTCRATGWVKCDHPECRNGVIEVARPTVGARTAKRLNEELIKKCPRCNGLAEVPCAQCKGSGSVACKTCDGSGHAARCSRCTGSGLMTCTKCKGSGEVKGGVCPECKGETVTLCTACRGEGAVSR